MLVGNTKIKKQHIYVITGKQEWCIIIVKNLANYIFLWESILDEATLICYKANHNAAF